MNSSEDFRILCERLHEILPSLKEKGGSRSPVCGISLINFCVWCIETFKLEYNSGSDYVQRAVLNGLNPHEIREAYARWRLEKGDGCD